MCSNSSSWNLQIEVVTEDYCTTSMKTVAEQIPSQHCDHQCRCDQSLSLAARHQSVMKLPSEETLERACV